MDLPDALPPGQYVVYVLIDPTDHLVYYVGQTRNPRVRFVQHLTTRHHKGTKAEWLRRLEQQGQRPQMQILELVKGEEAALAKEKEWIRHFTEKGMPLLNAQTRSKADRWAMIPLRQETLILFGYPIVIVWLANGEIAASLKSLCNMLKLARQGQLQRILRNHALSEQLLLVMVETPGGSQPTEVLTVKAIPAWLKGLQLNMVTAEKQPTILTLIREAPDIFYRHFFNIDDDQKASTSSSQAAELGDHIVVLEADVATLKQRQVSKAEATPAGKQPLPQDGPILTAEHRDQVYVLARYLRDQTGESLALLFAELAKTFGVEDMSDIPDDGWEQVKAWFWLRAQRTNNN